VTDDRRLDRQRRYDTVTVLLLMVGGLVLPFVGWLVSVGMLWAGPRWTRREKLLGTLVWPLGPGGLLLLAALLPTSTEVCSRGPHEPAPRCTTTGWSLPAWLGVPAFGAVVVVGLAVGLFLIVRARRRDPRASATGRGISAR
jgi:hypothetical protein